MQKPTPTLSPLARAMETANYDDSHLHPWDTPPEGGEPENLDTKREPALVDDGALLEDHEVAGDVRQQPSKAEAPVHRYVLPEIEGHEWSQADMPNLVSFLNEAHRAGLRQTDVNRLASWYASAVGSAKRAPEASPKQANPDVGRRIAQIQRIMKTDIKKYYAEGLDQELTRLLSNEGDAQ